MMKRLFLKDVHVSHDRRTPSPDRVASVARSMKEVGQLNALTVNEDHRLIAGRTRLEAAKLLGWKDILCNVIDVDKLHAELAEIDENIERSNLTTLEEAQALAKRKAIYLELNPDTAQHVAGGKGKASPSVGPTTAESAVVEMTPTPSFAADTSANTGKAERTVRENVAIGENIAPAAAKAIKDTPIADNKGQLQQLVKLEPKQQVEVAKAIKSGEASTVQEAVTQAGVVLKLVGKRPRNNGQPVNRPKWKEIEGLLGKALNRVDELHQAVPHGNLHRQTIAAIKQAMAFLDQWKGSQRA